MQRGVLRWRTNTSSLNMRSSAIGKKTILFFFFFEDMTFLHFLRLYGGFIFQFTLQARLHNYPTREIFYSPWYRLNDYGVFFERHRQDG